MMKLAGRPGLWMGLWAAVLFTVLYGVDILDRYYKSPQSRDVLLHHDKGGVLMGFATGLAFIVIACVVLFLTRNWRNYARD